MGKNETQGKISSEAAEELLKSWAEYLELDTDRDLYTDLVDELRMPVRLQRLTFDEETETFKYLLINGMNGKGIVEIKECDFNAKKVIQRYKETESIAAAGAMLSKYTNLTAEEIGQLKERDVTRINAVVMGFLAQMAPGGR